MGLNSTHQDDGDDDDSLASDVTGSVLNGAGKWQRHACLHKAISSIDVSSTHIPAANLMTAVRTVSGDFPPRGLGSINSSYRMTTG